MAPSDLTTDPFADARNHMVDSQLRPNKVTDPRILAPCAALPRERFLPPALAIARLCGRGRAAGQRPRAAGADGASRA